MASPATTGQPGRPSRRRVADAVEDLGCFLPPLLGATGLTIGWWLAGYVMGVGLAVACVVVGLWIVARFVRSNAPFELGCAFAAIGLAFVVALAPAVHKIRERAAQIRAEREAPQPAPPMERK